MWFVLVVYFIINILLPSNGLRKQDHFNAFLWRTLYDLWNCIHTIVKGLTGHTGKITWATNINLVAESNAIPMPSANQALRQSLQEIPPVEETPADGPLADEAPSVEAPADDSPAAIIIFVVEVNAITVPTDYQTQGQFLQEMPSVEEPPADGPLADGHPADEAPTDEAPAEEVPAEEAPTNDFTVDDAPAANAPANDAPAGNVGKETQVHVTIHYV